MTLLYIDGFAHANTGRYSGSPSWTNMNTNGLSISALQPYWVQGPNIKRAVTASAEVFTGFRFRMTVLTADTLVNILSDSGATTHLTVALNSSAQLTLFRGTQFGTVIATGTTSLATGAWRYIEVRATIADSGGICQVRLDGNSEINFTGDTRNAGTSTNIDALNLGINDSGFGFTDWYIANALGSAPSNTWLGDTVVRTLTPSGDGDRSQLVGSDGDSVSNYQQVDELPPSTTDYNGSPTVGNEDTYAMTDLPSTGVAVFGAQVSTLMAKSDAGTGNAKSVLRLSGTDYTSGGTRSLTTSYTEYLDLYATNPATSSQWAGSEINAAQIGMQVA